mgnify:CR=1 FL=1|tara:strand:- start:2367 stop:4445 length:2079 start_codon:yes stop_codon:yes gene_type:complete
MAFTLPTNYANALSSPFKENILVRLYYDASNYTSIALYDQTVSSVSYTGCILNNPAIRQSIDLKASTAKSANITLNCADATFGSDKLSALLIAGSNNYLNKKVELYSILNDSSSSSDQIKLYTGRLQSVSMDDSRVNINIVEQRPYDLINLPNIKSDNNTYIPVAYGDYDNNKVTGLTTLKSVYPAPLSASQENKFFYHTPKSYTSSSLVNYYDNANDLFPFLAHDFATVTFEGKDAIGISNAITRTYRIRATAINDSNQWTNAGNAFDTDNTTFALANAQGDTDTPVVTTKSLYLNMPNITGKITFARFYIKADVTYTESDSTVEGTVAIRDDSFGNNNTIISKTDSNGTVSTSGNADPDGTGTAYGFRDWTSDVASNNNQLPNAIKINLTSTPTQDDNSHTLDADGKVYDIYLQITSANDYTNEPIASTKDLPEYVYIGGDGLEKSWSSGVATKIHEFHRDILYRYLDITTAPTNYSTLDTARSSWTARFWGVEPTSAKDILETLQYEGGFIFLLNQDIPKYIFIPDSISADHANVTKSQINKLKISHTGIGDLITKMTINYEKHPAKNEHLTTTTYTSAERANYNFTTNENVAEVNLDALVGAVSGGSNRNDSFTNYYDKITGTLKLLISCDFVDPSLGAKVEVGDFVTFDNSNMATAPFGGAWTSKNFIVTSVNRKLGAQASVQLQEV